MVDTCTLSVLRRDMARLTGLAGRSKSQMYPESILHDHGSRWDGVVRMRVQLSDCLEVGADESRDCGMRENTREREREGRGMRVERLGNVICWACSSSRDQSGRSCAHDRPSVPLNPTPTTAVTALGGPSTPALPHCSWGSQVLSLGTSGSSSALRY